MKKKGKFINFVNEKKGFEMLWSTWVIMIVAVVLLMFILVFFALGSGNFMDNINAYFTKTNVDSVVKGCNIFVDSNNQYDFCCEEKTVKYSLSNKIKTEELSCFELVNKSFINNQIKSGIECAGFSC